MGHCSGNAATDRFDMLTPMVNWIENGVAPKEIVATGNRFLGDGRPAIPACQRTRSRPLCAYPKTLRYRGRRHQPGDQLRVPVARARHDKDDMRTATAAISAALLLAGRLRSRRSSPCRRSPAFEGPITEGGEMWPGLRAGRARHHRGGLRLCHRGVLRLGHRQRRGLQDAHHRAPPRARLALQRHRGGRVDALQRLRRHLRAGAQVVLHARPCARRDRRAAEQRQHHAQGLQPGALCLAQHPVGTADERDHRAGRRAR